MKYIKYLQDIDNDELRSDGGLTVTPQSYVHIAVGIRGQVPPVPAHADTAGVGLVDGIRVEEHILRSSRWSF